MNENPVFKNDYSIFKVVRKEIISEDNVQEKTYLLTLELVFLKKNINLIKEIAANYPSLIFILTRHKLALGQIYTISSSEIKTLDKKSKMFEYCNSNFTKDLTLHFFDSKPKKFYNISALVKYSELYEDTLEDFICVNYQNHTEVRVYNVDQGNMNTIHYENEVILYDWGTDNISPLSGIPRNLDVNQITTIFLSHHHFDHYSIFINGIFKNLKSIIIPDNILGTSLVTFFARHSKAKIIVIPLASPKKTNFLGKYGDLKLYIGPQTGSKSNKNNEGIVVNIERDNKITSLTGDIYWYLYCQTIRKYSIDNRINFVIPHHGGNIGKRKVKLLAVLDRAIYSYGKGNRHGHPSSTTLSLISHYTYNTGETYKLKYYDYYVL